MQVESLKPNAKTILKFEEIPITPNTVVQIKADGEFTKTVFLSDPTPQCFTINIWNTKRTNIPCLTEFSARMQMKGVKSIELLAELYAVHPDGTMAMLPDFIHNVKGSGDPNTVRIGVFDLLTFNGEPMLNQPFLWKMQEVQALLEGCEKAQVLPYITPATQLEAEEYWVKWVLGKKYEGFMVHTKGDLLKLKPRHTVDAVIVGINKRKSIKYEEVTSLKTAVMNDDGSYAVIGDVASGIDHQLRKSLWKLTQFKLSEDSETIWIKPFVIVEIEYTQTFDATIPRLNPDMQIATTQKGFTLRHPRLLRFRTDKHAKLPDIRLEQLR